jgi:hypothetical protein
MPTRRWRGKQAQGPKTGLLLDRKLALECLLNLFGAPSLRGAFPFGYCWRIQAEPLKFPQWRLCGSMNCKDVSSDSHVSLTTATYTDQSTILY